MSNTVDTRVVEMRFDNHAFEQGVKTSLNTIEQLKKSLNFNDSAKQLTSLQNATNRIDFSPFLGALDSVQNRFSALGIAGATVINDLTNTILSKVKSLLSAIPNMISQGGLARALNIEQAKFQLEGLGIAWKDIKDDIDYGVKDTAYGLDSAAKAAAQLVASNVNLGDEMKTSLRAISGVAAMTNRSYDDIAHIFTTTAGLGRVQQMQLRQLAISGLNASAKLAEYFNGVNSGAIKASDTTTKSIKEFTKGLQVTQADIDKFTRTGVISYGVFAEAMDNAFGEHAKEANKTYSGALSNVKAALSRLGAEVKTSRIENLRQIFVAAIPAINKFKADVEELILFVNTLSSVVTQGLVKAIGLIDFAPVLNKVNGFIGKINLGDAIKFEDVAVLLKKVKENGVLTNETLEEVESKGLRVTKILAERLDKTEEEVREAIKNGKVDFNAFAGALGAALLDTDKYIGSIKGITKSLNGVFGSIGNILKGIGIIIKDTFKAIADGFSKGFKMRPLFALSGALVTVKNMFNAVGDALNGFANYMAKSGNYNKIATFFEGIGAVLRNLYNIVNEVVNSVIKAFNSVFHFGEESTIITAKFDILCSILELFGKLMLKSDTAVGVAKKGLNGIGTILGSLVSKIKNALGVVDDFTSKINVDLTSIKKVFNTIKDILGSIASYLGETFSQLWENFTKPFANNNTNFLLSFIGMFELMLTTIFSSKTISSMKMAGITFGGFRDWLSKLPEAIKKFVNAPFEKIFKVMDTLKETLTTWQNSLKADIILKIAKAVALLAASMFVLSSIDPDKLKQSVESVIVIITALTLSMKAFAAMKLPDITKMGGVMAVLTALGFSVLLLSVAAKNLSGLDWEALATGLAGVGGLMAELVGFVGTMSLLGGKKIKVSGFVGLSIAIYILSKALQELSSIDSDVLGTGLGAMSAIFGMLGIFTNIINPKRIVAIGFSMNLIAASMIIFAKGLAALGEIPIDNLKTGLIGMGAALGIVAIAMHLMPKGSIFDGVAMIIAAKALIVLSEALNSFSGIPMNSLKTGLIGMGVALGEIVVAMMLMKGAIPGALALIIIAKAMKVLSGVLVTFSAIPVDKLVVALIAFGAALTILVLAGMGAAAVAPGLLALGASIALIGAGCLMAGAGLLAFGAGLALLVSLGSAGLSLLASSLLVIINMIPVFMAQLGYGLIALADVLANGYDSFVRLGVTVIAATCDGIIQSIPKLLELVDVLMNAVEVLLFEYAPRIINWGVFLLLSLIDGITQAMPDLVEKAFVLIITFINSMSDALDEHGEEFWDAVDRFILSVLDFLGLKVKDWAQAAKDWLAGLKQGFEDKAEEIKENIKQFVNDKIVQPIKDKWEDFKDAGAYLIQGFLNGLENTPVIGPVVGLGRRIISHFNNSLGEQSPSKLTEMSGEYFIEGFVNGLNNSKFKAVRAVDGVVKALDINGKRITIFDEPTRAIQFDAKNFVEKSVEAINWGEKTISAYVNRFGKTLDSLGVSFDLSTQTDFARKSIAKLSKTLYLNSQEYRESSEKVQEYVNSIKEQEDYIKELNKEIAKQQKAARNGSDEAVRNLDALNNELETAKDTLKDMGADLSSELTAMANGAKNAFDTLRTGISDNVRNSIDILKVSVTNYVDLFSKFQEIENIPVERILKSMRSQIVGVSKWRNDLTELGKRGISEGLLDQLRNMGVDGQKYIQAFLKMTDEELSEANLMFRAKNELTSQTLIDGMKDQFRAIEKWTSNIESLATKGINFDLLMDLQEAGPDNAEYVQALADMTAAQIEEVNELYKKSKELPTSIADRVLSSLALSNENKGNIAGEEMASALAEVLNGEGIGEKFTEALAVGLKKSETSIAEASKVIGESSLVEFNKYFSTEKGNYVAVNMVNGLVNGLITGQSVIADASRELARAAYNSTTDELGIHSPSTAFEQIGMYSDMGLANGLLKYSSMVSGASGAIGDNALETMRESMNRITDLLNEDVYSPVITPTLDLSDISNNAGRINKMFDDQTIGTNLEDLPGIQNGKVFNFTQNNYSPKALSRIEIYRQTKNQFSTLKGMV